MLKVLIAVGIAALLLMIFACLKVASDADDEAGYD